MKKTKLYIIIALGILLFSCNQFSEDVKEIKTSSGSADFTNYIALGNSLTAGFQDGALYKSGQENSIPAMIAKGMNLSYEFKQPLMSDELGGIPSIGIANKRILTKTQLGIIPTVAKGKGISTLENLYKGKAFHNLGIPGAKVAHLLAKGYGNPAGLKTTPVQANPYYVRFASSPASSVLEDALAAKPTFFSLWIGNNDALGYATSGGDGSNPLTSEIAFTQYYNAIINKLTTAGAKGIVANIPYVSSIPFFNTVPNNALKLDATKAKKLTGFFSAVQAIATKILVNKGIPVTQAKSLAAQYGINFSEGKNRFLIKTEITQKNPLGFRQMAESELLLLTINQKAIKEKGYGSVALTAEVIAILEKLQKGQSPSMQEAMKVIAAINPIADSDVLDAEELALIKNAINAYNKSIRSIAESKGLAFFDANAMMTKLSTTGIRIGGVDYSSTFVTGGVFSLDGIHPNQRGYAIIANEFIKAINQKYNANIPEVDPNSYTGVSFP